MALVFKDRVKEITTTTGTGALTLVGAMTGFRAFSTVCSVGDTCRYAIQAVDGTGAPSGAWEVGVGTYSAANTLTRTKIIASSNSNAAVNFSAGNKQVWIGLDAAVASWPRERLTDTRFYYVRTDGNNNNDGLTDTAGGAFQTIQKAVDVVCGLLDMGDYNVYIKLAAGTYNDPVTLKRYVGTQPPIIEGYTGESSMTRVVSVTSGDCFANEAQVPWIIRGLKVTASNGNGLSAKYPGSTLRVDSIEYGACSAAHVFAEQGGSIHLTSWSYVNAGANDHLFARDGGLITLEGESVGNTPAFTYYARSWGPGASIIKSSTIFGAATGQRYSAMYRGGITTFGGGANSFPGSIAGSTLTDGSYT